MSLKSDLILAHLEQLPAVKGEAIDLNHERTQANWQLEQLMVDYMLVACPDAECSSCAEIVCPHADIMHFHHDGCPSCAERT